MSRHLTTEELEVFHESLERVLSNSDFVNLFYESFLDGSEEIQAFFINSDMPKLKRKLSTTLRLMTLAVDNSPGADMYLEYLGKYHYDIQVPRELYSQWLDALLASIQVCDQEFDIEIESIWRTALSIGIEEMLKAYE